MNELVSIVVPIYNTELYLSETIASVLSQTYNNWELLLIDDGSIDKSAEICRGFSQKDKRIQYYFKQNGGQASARNFGIKKSSGAWIAFLDSDDIWLPSKLEDQFEAVEAHNPDFLYGLGYYFYEEKDEQLVPYEWITGQRSGKDFFQILYASCAVNTNTVLIKKALFETVGFFNESEILRGTEDWDLWLRISKKIDTVYGSPKRNVYYRIHDNGIHLQHVRMLRGKAEIYGQYDNDKKVSRLLRLKEYRYIYREMMNRLWEENKGTEIKLEFKNFVKKDTLGFGTLKQRILIKILPINAFMWVSQKIIYRIAYRLEKLTYTLFLK
ncbi:MAG: glycosyltransferase family 2 protein [Crocinitomicaceae bacterium]